MRRLVGLGVGGVIVAWLLAVGLGDSVGVATVLAGISASAALVVGIAGVALLMTSWRQLPVASQLGTIIAITVAAVAAGALAAGAAMFLPLAGTEDLLVVLVSAGAVGAVVAQLVAGHMAGGIHRLGVLAARMGEGPLSLGGHRPVPTRELAALADRLEEVSGRLYAVQARERALEAGRRELLAWISHDLRTPLSGIQAMAEALEDGVAGDRETVARYHRNLQIEVTRLAAMVDDLFQLSRISSGVLDLKSEVVVLADLVSDALAVAGPVALAKGVRLDARPIDPGIKLDLSTAEFLRVLHNLLENALRHTPEGGQVALEAACGKGEVVLMLRDGCGGIPPNDLGRVFEAGFRGDPARTPSPPRPSSEGAGARAGLGLAIAQGLAAAHGGRIVARNEGGGCCFCLHLPLRQASHPCSEQAT